MKSKKNYQVTPEVISPDGKANHTKASRRQPAKQSRGGRGRFSQLKVLIPVLGFSIISGGLLLAVSLAGPREANDTQDTVTTNIIDDSTAYGEVGLRHSPGDIGPSPVDDLESPRNAEDSTVQEIICPDAPGDCSSVIQDLIDNTEERPLQINFTVSEGSDSAAFNQAVKISQQVSVLGVNNPTVTIGDQATSIFDLSQAQDSAVGGFSVDLDGCQGAIESIFKISQSGFTPANVHVNNINTLNGDRYVDVDSGQVQLLFKDYSRCDFLQVSSDTDGLFISNIVGDHFRKFVSIDQGSHQRIAIFNNSIDLLGQSYISQSTAVSSALMQIYSNRFSKIATSSGDTAVDMIDLSFGRISDLNISGNIIEAPSYKTASISGGQNTINAQLVPSLSGSLIAVGSIDRLGIEDNILRWSSDSGVKLSNNVRIGTIRNNQLLHITGEEISKVETNSENLQISNNLSY